MSQQKISERASGSALKRSGPITPTTDAVADFNGVTAPYKKLVLIPDAGHFAFMTAPDAFLGARVDEVRPVAVERGA